MEGLAEIITDFFNSIGHKQTFGPKADINRRSGYVRFVPIADSCTAAKSR
jgi:hypothetical protein